MEKWYAQLDASGRCFALSSYPGTPEMGFVEVEGDAATYFGRTYDRETGTWRAQDTGAETDIVITMVEKAQFRMMALSTLAAAPEAADAVMEALAPVARVLAEPWIVGKNYAAGELVNYEERCYIIVKAHAAQAHQPPGSEGMLAIYRPFDAEQHAGTLADPIPWVGGMDCYQGKYYSYEGKVYQLVGTDLLPSLAHFYPGAAGVHYWVLQE